MLRKRPSLSKVIMFGITIGVAVIVIGYFAMYFQRNKSLEASKKGIFPKMPAVENIQKYTTDKDGEYYFSINYTAKKTSEENIIVWSRLVYSQDGLNSYIRKRKHNGLFTEGIEQLEQRNVLYEFKCTKDKPEYTIHEIYEVGKDGKTLDYGKTDKDREWGYVPPGSHLESLSKVICAKK